MNPIVGIGELLWDIYPDGRKVLGGAPFNFAFHCHQLGHDAVIVSRVGDDDLGRELREEVKRLGMSDEFIQTDYEHPTGTVRVTLDAQGQPVYEIAQDVAWDYIEWNGNLALLSEFSGAVCFGTLGQRSQKSTDTIDWFVGSVYRKFRVFDLNYRQRGIDGNMTVKWMRRSSWIKLNELEMNDVRHWPLFEQNQNPISIADLFQIGLAWDSLVIHTKGEAGCELYSPDSTNKTILHVPGVPAKVIDSNGAGDAFTAAMVVMHLEGKPLEDCARFASHYAAKVCEHRGATPNIDRSEIEKVVFR